MAVRDTPDTKEQIAKQLAQNLRNDFHLLSTEARKKYPAVRESSERGAMRLKHLSEQHGYSLRVLASTEDVVRPLLFACESQSPRIIVISLTSLQRLLQYNAIPQSSVESILVTLNRLVDNNLEELKVLQTIVILVTSTNTVRGKTLTQVLLLCFKLYSSRDVNLHNTASVTIRQIVQTLFDRLNSLAAQGGLNSPEPPPPDSSPSVSVDHRQLPIQVRDSYLIFQDLCFLINGDPAAWLPQSLNIELGLGLELLEIVLKGYPAIFAKEKLFSVLLTERVCPLVIKLFSPSSKHRNIISPQSSGSALIQSDKPTFALHIRLLRILRVLIKEYFIILITQCEIFLSMLVRFLDSDKPLWQRILAVEVLHLFMTDSFLLKSFCECYDMHEHSTKVFNDMINGLAAFIQSSFHHVMSSLANNASFASSPGHVMSNGSGSTNANEHVFVYRSVTLHSDVLGPSAYLKPFLLEMLDKSEVPSTSEGYPLVLSMTALLDTVKSLSLVVHNQCSPTPSAKCFTSASIGVQTVSDLSETMLTSCWSPVLAALTLLFDAACDDYTCKNILEAFKTFIQLCGVMNLISPRDAFLTTLCKCALPPKYALSLVTQPTGGAQRHGGVATGRGRAVADSSRVGSQNRYLTPHDPNRKRSDTSAESGVGGGTLLSSGDHGKCSNKNIKCILTLLHLVHQHGEVLESAWHLILTTLQCISNILGITKSKSAFNKPSTDSGGMLSVSANEKRMEVTEIAAKFDGLFLNSKFLSNKSLLSLINALCQLSDESLQNISNKDSCLFPISSLLEIGLANTNQVELIWKTITSQFTQLCSCSDSSVRLEAADSLSMLVKAGLVDQTDNKDVQSSLLQPLLSLSTVTYSDVHQKQLECVEQLLHLNHQLTCDSWIIILEILNNISKLSNEGLIRSGFQSLQLIVTDFLPILPTICLLLCVEVTGHYGLQTYDINTSLSSIGHLWNIADFLYQNRETVHPLMNAVTITESQLTNHLLSSCLHSLRTSLLSPFDTLWMQLFLKLTELVINEQSAIRKSAATTLFSTLSAHGSLLEDSSWKAVLWQVLFAVLKKVQTSSLSATSSSSITSSSSTIMIHHSRDTAQKQWAETHVIVLTGVSRVVQSRLHQLSSLEGFDRAWTSLLNTIKDCIFTGGNNEISMAGLNSFKMILTCDAYKPPVELWESSWLTWIAIGQEVIIKRLPSLDSLTSFISTPQSRESIDDYFSNIPDQPFLLSYLDIFPPLVAHLSLTSQQLSSCTNIFQSVLMVPASKDTSPFIIPSVTDAILTNLQRQIITCLSCIITSDSIFDSQPTTSTAPTSLINKSTISDLNKTLNIINAGLYESVIGELLLYSSYSWSPNAMLKLISDTSTKSPVAVVSMVPFSLSCLVLAIQMIRSHQYLSLSDDAISSLIMHFLKVICVPFSDRYKLYPSSLWVVPLKSLLIVMETFFPLLLSKNHLYQNVWSELANVLNSYLFAPLSDSVSLSSEQLKHSEEFDIKIVKMVTSNVHNGGVPSGFMSKWTHILNEGSLAPSSTSYPSLPFRENFTQVCFESLLQISFMQTDTPDTINANSQMALDAVLDRSEKVLTSYIQEEKLMGNCPPSRSSMNEVSLVLKSLRALITSLKQQEKTTTVQSLLWNRIYKLFPVLVDCVTCNSYEIRIALKDVLSEFGDIILASNKS